MEKLREYLVEQINEQLILATLSASRGNGPSKVKIRPVQLKNEIVYQASATEGRRFFIKIIHEKRSLPIWSRSSQLISVSCRPQAALWTVPFL